MSVIIAVVDGMGGGIGTQIVTQIRKELPLDIEIIAKYGIVVEIYLDIRSYQYVAVNVYRAIKPDSTTLWRCVDNKILFNMYWS